MVWFYLLWLSFIFSSISILYTDMVTQAQNDAPKASTNCGKLLHAQCITRKSVNLTGYLSTGDSTTLHLPDAPHLLLHLLLLHQDVKVALLQLVFCLHKECDMEMSLKTCNFHGIVFKCEILR